MIRFANAKAAEFMGYTREELTTISFVEFAHPDDRAMVVDRHFQRLKGIDVNVPSEFRVVSARGRSAGWNCMQCSSMGRKSRHAEFCHDITERKRAEEERVRMEAASSGTEDGSSRTPGRRRCARFNNIDHGDFGLRQCGQIEACANGRVVSGPGRS